MSTPSDALDPSLRELVESGTTTAPTSGVGELTPQLTPLLDAAAAALRQRLSDARDDLLQRAQRALAYARVYADGEGPADLAAQLDALVLPRTRSQRPAPAVATAATTTEPAAPRKRGRPRKEPQPTTLFAAAPGPTAPLAAAPVVS